MKQAKISLAALTVLVSSAAAVSFRSHPKPGSFPSQWFDYSTAGPQSAAGYHTIAYYTLDGQGTCPGGKHLCQIYAPVTQVNGTKLATPLPAGFATAVAVYNSNGGTAVNATEIDGITVTFITPG